jgi:hypothetical protein
MSNYISLKDLVNRDVGSKMKSGKYQIQSLKNSDSVKFVSFEKEYPDFCIMENDIDDFKCSLIQYSLSDNDIENKNFSMIGYLIKNKNKNNVIGILDFIFVPENSNLSKDFLFGKTIKGKFNIILSNNKNEKKIIKTIDKYVGNENIVHFMTEILGDCLLEIIETNK